MLTGEVSTKFERLQAAELAKNTAGVSDVTNAITLVREAVAAEDWRLRSDIQIGLYWSPLVNSEAVLVTVDHGIAMLTGVVDRVKQCCAARQIALDAGAKQIDNNLNVKSGAPHPPVS